MDSVRDAKVKRERVDSIECSLRVLGRGGDVGLFVDLVVIYVFFFFFFI